MNNSKEWLSIFFFIAVILVAIMLFQKGRKGANRLDCVREKCFDKNDKEIPLSKCTEIGLMC